MLLDYYFDPEICFVIKRQKPIKQAIQHALFLIILYDLTLFQPM